MANGEFNHRLSDYIVVIRGIISKEMCQQVIDLYKNNSKWDWALTTGGLDLDRRKVKQVRISDPAVLQQGSQYEEMDSEIFKVMSKAKDMYVETLEKKRGIAHLPSISSDEGYQFLHYSEGYYFKEHCDNSGGMSRILTCTLNISDDHDGGLFRFLRGEFDVRLNAGDAVLFPSNFLFPHEVTEITRGERHAIVTWFH
jgi:Rps23 Pro-64 3,4-dihydroxylase Tpa1-like proline 4-hydroxylase